MNEILSGRSGWHNGAGRVISAITGRAPEQRERFLEADLAIYVRCESHATPLPAYDAARAMIASFRKGNASGPCLHHRTEP